MALQPKKISIFSQKKSCLRENAGLIQYFQCRYCWRKDACFKRMVKHQMRCGSKNGKSQSDIEQPLKLQPPVKVEENLPNIRALDGMQLDKKREIKLRLIQTKQDYSRLTKLLQVKDLPHPKINEQIESNRVFYSCNYCHMICSSLKRVLSHQKKNHFFEIKELQQFIVQQNALSASLSREQNFQRSQIYKYFRVIYLNPFFGQYVYRLYKCNFCSYVQYRPGQLRIHNKKLCRRSPFLEANEKIKYMEQQKNSLSQQVQVRIQAQENKNTEFKGLQLVQKKEVKLNSVEKETQTQPIRMLDETPSKIYRICQLI